MSTNNSIFVRAFAAVADEIEARPVREAIQRMMAQYGTIVRSDTPKQYWKNNDLWEVFIELIPRTGVSQTFHTLLECLGSGWSFGDQPSDASWAVWNPGANSHFFIPEVRWANVECLYRSRTDGESAR
jgi:hypothetical protein